MSKKEFLRVILANAKRDETTGMFVSEDGAMIYLLEGERVSEAEFNQSREMSHLSEIGFQSSAEVMPGEMPYPGKTVLISVALNAQVAMQLVRFCKRATINQFLEVIEDHLPDAERNRHAYQMITGIDAVGRALIQAGVNPG